jgi:hypothetical protein
VKRSAIGLPGHYQWVRRVLAYFGLDGSVSRRSWVQGGVEALPPVVVSAVAAWLVGARGWVWWLVWTGFMTLAWVGWLPLIARLPWRRREAESDHGEE